MTTPERLDGPAGNRNAQLGTVAESSSPLLKYEWTAHPIHTHPTQPSDLLPNEAFEPGETQFYSSLIKYGLPTESIVRTYRKQKSANAVASGSKTSEAFSVGDTVLVVSAIRTTSIAVITVLRRVAREDNQLLGGRR
jgi:hypothetical protein